MSAVKNWPLSRSVLSHDTYLMTGGWCTQSENQMTGNKFRMGCFVCARAEKTRMRKFAALNIYFPVMSGIPHNIVELWPSLFFRHPVIRKQMYYYFPASEWARGSNPTKRLAGELLIVALRPQIACCLGSKIIGPLYRRRNCRQYGELCWLINSSWTDSGFSQKAAVSSAAGPFHIPQPPALSIDVLLSIVYGDGPRLWWRRCYFRRSISPLRMLMRDACR